VKTKASPSMHLRQFLFVLCFSIAGILIAGRAAGSAIDFSHAGYGGGGVTIPSVPVIVAITPSGADDTAVIQDAIEKVSALPLDLTGFRGAVVLRTGTYRVNSQLKISASGVVLRGEKATIIATGQSRRTLIFVGGKKTDHLFSYKSIVITDAPAGSTQLTLASVDNLTAGMRVAIRRPSTKEWIHDLGMDQFTGNFPDIRLNWSPGSRDLVWDRTVVGVDSTSRTATLDAPITTALEARYGGATIQAYEQTGQLHHVGIEGLALCSEYDATNTLDEEHAWIAIQMEYIENAWVRDITAKHFVSAAVWLGTDTKTITIQDCRSEAPISEDAGWRRFGFYVGGQQVLVQRCVASAARQPFLAGLGSAGPNVFLDCTADHATGDSGSIESWASGVLFDNVKIEDAGLILGNLGEHWQGAGWNAANSTLWNCAAKLLTTDNPPGAINQVINEPANSSLYRTQLAARLGEKALAELASSKPPSSPDLKPTPSITHGPERLKKRSEKPLGVTNGHFTTGEKTLFGGASSNAWWKGQTIPSRSSELGWSATRWAPGRTGSGLTEDLPALAAKLAASGNTLVHVWPGLWYDRRRDDHKTVSRADAETWAPFYEQPWARSGSGRAVSGLSKYDLTKFNPWYWSRLRDFAAECASREMILYHHFYNHHNLVEAAAHWADFPWRPANCLQETGFSEPPPYTNNGTRIGLVGQFYDISHPVRREMHRLYIWHGLDALADQPNVVHTLGFQFAGPLSFQQFFLDTVAEWEASRGKRIHIALNTSKAVTDAILADPVRAQLVDVIDQRYWQYLADGSLFSPDSGGKLAFREQRTAAFGKDAVPPGTPELVYKQVREYHDRFPNKAIISGHAGQGPIPILMAGGALPLLADYASSQPLKTERDDRAFINFIHEHLATVLAQMHPVDVATDAWCLADGKGDNQLYYSPAGESLILSKSHRLRNSLCIWFDPKTGATQPAQVKEGPTITKPTSAAWLLLIQRRH
jgi:hypothetical protein